MFGLVLGTLNKAKIEDKERNASEAVGSRNSLKISCNHGAFLVGKNGQLTEKRLQTKLRNETDSVRRAEEAKKNKNAANRKEEDLQLKDSIVCLASFPYPHLLNITPVQDPLAAVPCHCQFLANI